GNKTGEEDGLAAVLFEERMCLVEIFLLKPLDVIGAFSQIMTDGVVDRIPEHSCKHQEPRQVVYVQRSKSREGTGCKQKRITRQDRGYHKSVSMKITRNRMP